MDHSTARKASIDPPKSVKRPALPLERIHHVQSSNRLPLGVLGVCHSIPDHVFQKHLEHPPGLFVDQARDTFDTTATGETADGGLGDSLDVVAKDFAVTFCAA